MKPPKIYLNVDGTMYRLDQKKHPLISRFLATKWDEITKEYDEMKASNKSGFTMGYNKYPYYNMDEFNWALIQKEIGKKIHGEYIVVCYDAQNQPVVLLKRSKTIYNELVDKGIINDEMVADMTQHIVDTMQKDNDVKLIEKDLNDLIEKQ